MEDTSGFYKLDTDAEEHSFFYAPNFVYGPNGFQLLRENKDQYTYPVDGWYWFDTEQQARQFWNIPLPEEIEQ